MQEVCWATQLYPFLKMCNESPLPRIVLDCGAGGSDPPMSLFYQHGYRVFGIEIAEYPLGEVQKYCLENGVPLEIIQGDIRKIPFPSNFFSFVYSFNAIDFMTKPDISITMHEITRVLMKEGLCYVNFLSVDDQETWEPFCKTSSSLRFLNSEGFAHFEDDEADPLFEGYIILRKEKRMADVLFLGRVLKRAEIDYIARKK